MTVSYSNLLHNKSRGLALGLAALCYVVALAVMLPREAPLPVEE